MGLFDRIKKSLFGDKEKEEVKSEETTEEQETASENQEDSEKVEDQTSEETQEATESESDEETEESAPAAKKKEEEESQLNDEVSVETSIQEDEEFECWEARCPCLLSTAVINATNKATQVRQGFISSYSSQSVLKEVGQKCKAEARTEAEAL